MIRTRMIPELFQKLVSKLWRALQCVNRWPSADFLQKLFVCVYERIPGAAGSLLSFKFPAKNNNQVQMWRFLLAAKAETTAARGLCTRDFFFPKKLISNFRAATWFKLTLCHVSLVLIVERGARRKCRGAWKSISSLYRVRKLPFASSQGEGQCVTCACVCLERRQVFPVCRPSLSRRNVSTSIQLRAGRMVNTSFDPFSILAPCSVQGNVNSINFDPFYIEGKFVSSRMLTLLSTTSTALKHSINVLGRWKWMTLLQTETSGCSRYWFSSQANQ